VCGELECRHNAVCVVWGELFTGRSVAGHFVKALKWPLVLSTNLIFILLNLMVTILLKGVFFSLVLLL
jgi:hypothetical protein